MATAIAPTRLTSATGARIEGVDLREATGPVVEQLLAALHEHGVLVLPGQSMTAEDQLAFTARLGEVHAHPVREFLVGGGGDPISIVENDEHKPPQGDGSFHVDYSFAPEVPDLAVLRAEVIPPRGGDTVWANAGAAYDALSPRMQEFLAAKGVAKQYWPEKLIVLDDFPKTPSGKIQKFQLRATAADDE